jgi:hypothetical protein
MHDEGPLLDELTRRLAETPPDCLAEPRIGARGTVHVGAVVHDTVRDLGGAVTGEAALDAFMPSDSKERNRLRIVLLCTWLLHDRWFLEAGRFSDAALAFLGDGLREVSALVAADLFVRDPDRREELVRLCLAALSLRPSGESVAQAEDRLKTLNSVERVRLIRETQKQHMAARKLREAMRRRKAAEAAAKATRE